MLQGSRREVAEWGVGTSIQRTRIIGPGPVYRNDEARAPVPLASDIMTAATTPGAWAPQQVPAAAVSSRAPIGVPYAEKTSLAGDATGSLATTQVTNFIILSVITALQGILGQCTTGNSVGEGSGKLNKESGAARFFIDL